MRRISIMLLALLTAVSLLVLPGQSASAQTPPEVDRLHALVIGFTDPDENQNPEGHSLGVNRVVGESEFVGLQIIGELECDAPDPDEPDPEVVRFAVAQPEGGAVRFTTDDDITDGFGEVHGTDDARAFRDIAAEAIRAGGEQSTVQVEVRILGGEYHRVANYVDVNLRLNVRVVDDPMDPDVCESAEHEIRITFLIVGPSPSVTEGFTLVGVARTHELPDDRESIARTVCDTVEPHSTRVSEPTRGSTIPGGSTIPHGRGDFHPCSETPPETE